MNFAANSGDPEGQYQLAEDYEFGDYGRDVNYLRAARWYQLAADQGHLEAQTVLANMYLEDLPGLKKDYKKSFHYFEKAAKQGVLLQKQTLGTSTSRGRAANKTLKKHCFS